MTTATSGTECSGIGCDMTIPEGAACTAPNHLGLIDLNRIVVPPRAHQPRHWLKDNRVVAGMNVNVWDVNEHVQALIHSRQPVDPAALRDTDTPLDALIPAAATEAG
jgi:hypothetical protein